MGLRLGVKLVFGVAVLVCVFAASATLAQSTQNGESEKNREVTRG